MSNSRFSKFIVLSLKSFSFFSISFWWFFLNSSNSSFIFLFSEINFTIFPCIISEIFDIIPHILSSKIFNILSLFCNFKSFFPNNGSNIFLYMKLLYSLNTCSIFEFFILKLNSNLLISLIIFVLLSTLDCIFWQRILIHLCNINSILFTTFVEGLIFTIGVDLSFSNCSIIVSVKVTLIVSKYVSSKAIFFVIFSSNFSEV